MTGFQSKRQASKDLLVQALDALMCCSPDSEVGAALQIKTVADLRAHLAEPNEWRDAIDDELVCLHLGTVDSFHSAHEALDALINWHIATALDPAVSSAAQALVDRGRAVAEPLTDKQMDQIMYDCGLSLTARDIARAIEQAHGIKGEAA